MVSPTVRARQFGGGLAKLRKRAERTQKQAAALLECSQSTIVQIEKGRATIRRGDFLALMAEYGAAKDDIDRLDALRIDAGERGWWSIYDLPEWLSDYVGLEHDARMVCAFGLELVPGLLQTEAYAREVHVQRGALKAKEIDDRVAARVQRQARLTAAVDPLEFHAVISQSALQLCVDRPDSTGVGQLRHLHERAQLPNVQLQILPSTRGRHPGMQGAFTLLTFSDGVLPDVAYQEFALGGHIIDEEAGVASLTNLLGEIRGQALAANDSLTLLADLIRKIT